MLHQKTFKKMNALKLNLGHPGGIIFTNFKIAHPHGGDLNKIIHVNLFSFVYSIKTEVGIEHFTHPFGRNVQISSSI